MNTVLLLHGWEGNSENNWFPWLQEKLNSKMLDVYTPNLPHTNNPILTEQMEYIDIYASDFSKGGYIIAHSLGCQLAIKFIEENNINNSTIILVAPSYPNVGEDIGKENLGESYDYLNNYNNTVIDFEKINKLNNKYYIFLSDNDPYINMENVKKYYSKLKNIVFKDFQNKGHFNTNAKIFELPEILEYIK